MLTNIRFPFERIATKRIDTYPNKPTIIFLHDSLGSIELWRNFPEEISTITQCNVLIYDRQGYGKSLPFTSKGRDHNYLENEADQLIKLLSFWNIEIPILFGHSDGASIELIAAGKYPKKIKGIITEGAHIFVEKLTLEGIYETIEAYKTTNLKSRLQKYHGEKTEKLFWAWASTWTEERFKSWNIEGFLPTIECPALIIQGESDEYGTLKQVDGIINGIKGYSKQLIIPNVKHTPHKEVPKQIIDNTTTFIIEKIINLKPTI
jgi:pimeloyl-ACP methyl ester carboxylesterase